ncbi:hypothetical protein LX36DRAFT_497286 [Colletotrichum falcatum]|nr:hypothetical protein LX36DRAFT_497286 [Colletotrichum falcatum]
MMQTILSKFTTEKHFLERDWKAMHVNPKNPTDIYEFRSAAYEAKTLNAFFNEASILPEKDVYSLSVVSLSRTETPTPAPEVTRKQRNVKKTLPLDKLQKPHDDPSIATRSKTGARQKLTPKALEITELLQKRTTCQKRKYSQVIEGDSQESKIPVLKDEKDTIVVGKEEENIEE